MTSQETLNKTPLYEEHNLLNAKMVPFGGWEMPLQYEGILAEHSHTRRKVSLFDVSHMGEFVIEGDCIQTGLDRCVTMTIKDMPVKACRYGALLNEQGGVMDDLIIFREEEAKWFMVVNGATMSKDAEYFQRNLKDKKVFKNISFDTGKLDLQGPLSRRILSGFVKDIGKLDYYTFDYFDLLGENVLISRTGYTGELGYEIYFPWKKTQELWRKLIEQEEVKPAGLGARDVLRLEMGYSLYGHELDENITPLEGGLSRFVDFDKEFIGKDALLKQRERGPSRKIIGFTSANRRSPRPEHIIYSESEKEIGIVTSGTFSPELELGIGLAMVSQEHAKKDTKIFFGNEKIKNAAIITGKMFFKKGSLKK